MKRLISCVFVVISFSAYSEDGQKREVDSLYNLAWDYMGKNIDSVLSIASIQKKLALEIGYDLGVVNANYVTGFAYDELSYYDAAAMNYYQGLDLIQNKSEVEFRKKRLYLLQCLGIVYEKTFQYDNAIKYMMDALKIAHELGHKTSEGELLYNIAVNYRKKGELELAVEYHKKSLDASRLVNNGYLIARIYNSMGLIYDEKRKHNAAKEYFRKAVEIADTLPSLKKDLSLFQSNLGESFFLEGNFAFAKEYYLRALQTSIDVNDVVRRKLIFNNLGDVYQEQEDFQNAIYHYNQALKLCHPDILDKELQRAYKSLAETYEAMGEYKLASEYKSGYIAQADKIITIKEDLNQQNAQYRMKELEWQRELMQKEVLLASSEKENFWGRIIIGIALLLIVFSSRLIYVYYRKIYQARKIVNSYNVNMLDL